MLKIAVLYPELLGTYGDGGNALVLAARARRRGFDVEIIETSLEDEIPDAQILLLGGGEDGPQRQATYGLAKKNALAKRVDDGAVLLAVCAGFQLIGSSYEVEGGIQVDGLGIIEAVTTRGTKRRVGDLLTRVGSQWMVGFENHGGETELGLHEVPLGIVEVGAGNGRVGDHSQAVDGVRRGSIFGTYAHGPVLAQNPWLADELLSLALERELEPLQTIADALHRSRLRAVGDIQGEIS
ncbi:MAG: glutamine amidotransferase [Actinobacteria bacterium]|nr:glutamine amidotransferase [Actinomycetota bacterium]